MDDVMERIQAVENRTDLAERVKSLEKESRDKRATPRGKDFDPSDLISRIQALEHRPIPSTQAPIVKEFDSSDLVSRLQALELRPMTV